MKGVDVGPTTGQLCDGNGLAIGHVRGECSGRQLNGPREAARTQ